VLIVFVLFLLLLFFLLCCFVVVVVVVVVVATVTAVSVLLVFTYFSLSCNVKDSTLECKKMKWRPPIQHIHFPNMLFVIFCTGLNVHSHET
jgi:hypothetical protein